MSERDENRIWWHVYPLGFVGAEQAAVPDAPVVHRLDHLRGWLDYAAELGATGIALGPVFASSTHGYDTVDHLRIDPRLGDETDFDALVRDAHERGLAVLLDGVFNHVGRDFPAFREVLADPASPQARWFRLVSAPGAEPDYACFEGHRALVTLNHAEPAVADYVAGVMEHWLARGADGWRLDAAYAVPRVFWRAVLARVKAAYPDAYIVGEVIHGDYAAIVRDTGLDALTQYELWKATWSALNDRNLFELAHALERHNGVLDTFVPMTFVGNHDVTRIASQLKQIRHLPHALAILFAVGGTPSVYAGDEQGFLGVKENRAGGDDAIRPAFPASPANLPADGWPIYRLHQELIAVRRRHPWLARARTTRLHLANGEASFELRAGENRMILALNLSDGSSDLPAPGARQVEAGSGELVRAGAADARVALPPFGWALLATS